VSYLKSAHRRLDIPRTWHRFSHNASTLVFLEEVNRHLNAYLPDTSASSTCTALVSRNRKESYLHGIHPAYDLLPRGFTSFLSSIEFSPLPSTCHGTEMLILRPYLADRNIGTESATTSKSATKRLGTTPNEANIAQSVNLGILPGHYLYWWCARTSSTQPSAQASNCFASAGMLNSE
jgi:hypothetical protein